MEWTKTARIPLTLIVYLWIVPVASHVLPPTNVTLHCHNFRNVLYWNYSEPSPELKFKVFIGAIGRHYDPVWVDSPNLSANLSFLSDPKEDYFVTVSAVDGQNKSDSAPSGGIKFSYFASSPLDRKCSVDLPPVNVTLQPDSIKFSFQHPSLLYHQTSPTKPKRRQKKHQSHQGALDEFEYHVVTDPQMTHKPHHFICMESVCEDELPVDGEQTHCLRIYGQWDGVAVRSTQEYCTLPQTGRTTSKKNGLIPVYIVIGVLSCTAIGLIFFMVFRKQTRGDSSLPDSMTFPGRLSKKFMGVSLTPDPILVSQVQASPTDTPLLPTDIGEESVPGSTPVDDDFRLPIGVQDGSTSGGTVESSETESSGYMLGRDMDGEMEDREMQNPSEDYGNSSGYERRSRLVTEVEIVPGEKVEGYHG